MRGAGAGLRECRRRLPVSRSLGRTRRSRGRWRRQVRSKGYRWGVVRRVSGAARRLRRPRRRLRVSSVAVVGRANPILSSLPPTGPRSSWRGLRASGERVAAAACVFRRGQRNSRRVLLACAAGGEVSLFLRPSPMWCPAQMRLRVVRVLFIDSRRTPG